MSTMSVRVLTMLDELWGVYDDLRATNKQLRDNDLRDLAVSNSNVLVQLNTLASNCRRGVDDLTAQTEMEQIKDAMEPVSGVLSIVAIELNRLRNTLIELNRSHMRRQVVVR